MEIRQNYNHIKRAADSYMTELSVKQSEQVLSSPPEVSKHSADCEHVQTCC